MSIAYIPADAAVAINDMLDCCAVVKPGQNVLILAAIDGLYGGRNLVDEGDNRMDSVGSAGARRTSYRGLGRHAEPAECDLARYSDA
jgi:hypothetical protein